METMVFEKLILTLCLVGVDYVCVLLAMLADLRSGVMRARRNGERLSSGGFRRTVDKAGRYYVTLIAMTVIDAMLVCSVIFLWLTGGIEIAPLPVFTTLGGLGLCMIELKSIYENSQREGDFDKLLKGLRDAMRNEKVREALKELLESGKK